jgi:hypothetical protein
VQRLRKRQSIGELGLFVLITLHWKRCSKMARILSCLRETLHKERSSCHVLTRCARQNIQSLLHLLSGAVHRRDVHSAHPPTNTLLLVQHNFSKSPHCIYGATLVHITQRLRSQIDARYRKKKNTAK